MNKQQTTHSVAVEPLLKAHKSFGLIHKVRCVCVCSRANKYQHSVSKRNTRNFPLQQLFRCPTISGRYPNNNRSQQEIASELTRSQSQQTGWLAGGGESMGHPHFPVAPDGN